MTVTLLGGCQVARGDRFLTSVPYGFFRIVAYLLLEGRDRPVLRWRLSRLIWSENDPGHASMDLRQAIARIRRFQDVHGFRLITADATRLWLSEDSMVRCDLARLLDLMERPDPEAIVEMCALYDGRFLEVPGVAGSEFEEWLSFQRDHLRDRFMDMVSKAIAQEDGLTREQRDICARHMLKLDPCHEQAYRALMQSAADAGQMSAVGRLFDECTRKLRDELGVAPDEQTVVLYRRLTRRGENGAPERRAAPFKRLSA